VATPPGDFKNITVYRNAAGTWRFNLRVGKSKAENFEGDAGAADKARARRKVLKDDKEAWGSALAAGDVPAPPAAAAAPAAAAPAVAAPQPPAVGIFAAPEQPGMPWADKRAFYRARAPPAAPVGAKAAELVAQKANKAQKEKEYNAAAEQLDALRKEKKVLKRRMQALFAEHGEATARVTALRAERGSARARELGW